MEPDFLDLLPGEAGYSVPVDASGGIWGFRASLESETCREESTGESESWLSRLKKQHQGGLPRAPLSKDSCPS